MSDKCPKCGAERLPACSVYECGTAWYGNELVEDEDCLRIQVAIRDAENARLQEDAERSRSVLVAVLRFLATEIDWQFFRAEFFEQDFERTGATTRNANALRAYIEQIGGWDIMRQAALDAAKGEHR